MLRLQIYGAATPTVECCYLLWFEETRKDLFAQKSILEKSRQRIKGGKVARRDFNLYWEGRGSIKWSWGDYKEPRGITGSLRACKGEGPWRRLGAPEKFHASAKTDPKPSLGEKLEFFFSGFQGNIIKGTQVVIPPRIDGEILYRLEFWICVKQAWLIRGNQQLWSEKMK